MEYKNLQIPISEEDKEILTRKAKALKITVAGLCRLLIFQNLNKKEGAEIIS